MSETFEKILKNNILNKNLTEEEKDLISILNNNKLQPHQRLARYQQVLFAKLYKRTRDQRVDADSALAPSNVQMSGIGHRLVSPKSKEKNDKSVQVETEQETRPTNIFEKHFST